MTADQLTALTDLALAGQCLVYASALTSHRRGFALAFALWAVAFGGGALDHGFEAALGHRSGVWLTALIASAGAIAAYGTSAAARLRRSAALPIAAALVVVAYAAFVVARVEPPIGPRSDVFVWQGVLALPTFVALAVVGVVRPAHRALGIGAALQLTAAAVQVGGFGLGGPVDHNVVMHLIQLGAFHALYVAAR